MTLATQPCPACNGAIHPIAGRCKHCKTDLVAWRQQQAQAHAAAAQQQLRRTNKNAAPPPPAPPPRRGDAPTAPPAPMSSATVQQGIGTLAQDPGSGPSAAHYAHGAYAQPRSWSRRWPAVVAIVAVLAIGLSVGMMAERWRGDDSEASPEKASGSSTPMMLPDHMPDPKMPTSKLMPKLPFGMKKHTPIPYSGKAPKVGMFAVALTDGVCTKLSSCGLLDDLSEMLCRELARQLKDSDAAGKVSRGECTYNQSAAEACLGAIQGLSCTAKSADVMDWVTKAGSLTECTNAYICK